MREASLGSELRAVDHEAILDVAADGAVEGGIDLVRA